MICRRGGIEKQDVGTIRVLDTTTEFEISARAAASFAAKVRRPDKEDNIRIEPLADAARDHAPTERRSNPPRHDAGDTDRGDNSDRATERKHYGKSRDKHESKSGGKPAFAKNKDKPDKYRDRPAHAGQQPASTPHEKRKPKKKHRG
jgi:ATP-dependent RNA helicase DeaD